MRKLSALLFVVLILTDACTVHKALNGKKENLQSGTEETAHCDAFKTAVFSFLAQDLNTGEVIAAYNPYKSLKPASTLKLLTTATALEVLGPDYTFKTKLAYTGTLHKKLHYLDGNLIIIGGGDPALGSKYFEETKGKQFLVEFLEKIKNLGIDSVSGSVIADARYFDRNSTPPTWSWQNMGQYYGASPNGLTVYDNYFSILFDTGNYGDTAEITGLVHGLPGLTFENYVTADTISYDNAYVFGAPYSNHLILKGELPVNRKNFAVKAASPDPAFLAALQLDSVLRANNVIVTGEATTVRRLEMEGKQLPATEYRIFYVKKSPSLDSIIKQTNTHSINLFAEHCLLASGEQSGAKKEVVACADSMVSFWEKKGMDTQGLSVYDGSGLSHYDAVNAVQMIFLLNYMKNRSNYFKEFYNSLPIAGKTGTVENILNNTATGVRVKSGTISRVKAYAGYLTTRSGREIAFSMNVNNFDCTSREAASQLERLIFLLTEFDK